MAAIWMVQARCAALALLVAVLAGACARTQSPAGPTARGPLPRDLRARVDRFVAEGASPTTAESASDRVELLHEWGNAWSLAGHTLPVDLTLTVQNARQLEAQGDGPTEAVMRQLDRYLAELALLDADPRALGAMRFTDSEVLRAGSFTTLELVYTTGTAPPRRGAVFLVGMHFMSDQGRLQFEDPKADNYVTVRSSRPGAVFEPLRMPWASMHAGAGRSSAMMAYRLGGADLEPGDTVTFVYGDTSGGSRGFAVQSMSTRRFVLPVYVDLDGGGKFFSPAWDSLEIEGDTAVESIDVFAPSVVAPGERFTLAIRAADRWFNRPTGAIPGWEVRQGGEVLASVPPGGSAIAEVNGLTLRAPGVARLDVRSTDGRLVARSNPIWVRERSEPRIVWGELHGHTDFAEAQGTPEEYYDYGAEDARLDFIALTEHDAWLDAAEWKTLQRLASAANAEGRVIAFLAYEWTAQRATGGHHNVIFRSSKSEMVPFADAPTLPELYRGLHAEAAPEDVLVIPHAHTAGDWTQSDPGLERLVEMYSMHGTFEWFANLYLRNGWEVGFVGGSDDHRGKPGLARSSTIETLGQRGGLAAAIVPEKSAGAIFDALRGLQSYATSGQRILIDADLDGFGMGTRQPGAGKRKLRARVAGTAPIDRIDVVKNGAVVLSRDFATAALSSKVWVLVGFESSSEVFPPPSDSPRLYRVWEGTLDVSGARIATLDATGVDNRYTESVTLDTASPGRLRYHVETRGRRDVLLLELDAATSDTTLSFEVGPGREIGVGGVLARPPAQNIPPVRFSVRLGELGAGRFEHDATFERYADRISLQLVDVTAPLDQDFEWTDLAAATDGDAASAGDYYYLRVNQLDGSRAWSSPWWVGGSGRAGSASKVRVAQR